MFTMLRRIGQAALQAAPALALVLVAVCDGGRREGRDAAEPREQEAAGFSVYDLGSSWHDQFATARDLGSLRGRPIVMALIYTNCTNTCPMTVNAMQQVERRTDPNVGFLLVSLDPERDSQARLAEFARQHQLSPRWTLLSGQERSVRELAATIGVKYRQVSPTEIVHTTTLTILDADGRMVAQYSDADAVDRAVSALQRLNR